MTLGGLNLAVAKTRPQRAEAFEAIRCLATLSENPDGARRSRAGCRACGRIWLPDEPEFQESRRGTR